MSDEWKRLNEKGLDEIYFLRERVTELEQLQREVAEELRRLAIPQREPSHAAQAHIDALTALADRLDPPPVDATRSIHGGIHCAPPGGPNNTCYRERDGSCPCGYLPVVEDP